MSAVSFYNRDAYANPHEVEEIHTIEYNESEAFPIQQQSTQEATSEKKGTEYEVFINLLKNQEVKDPPTEVSEPMYDAYVNFLDVEDPIREKEDETVPDLSIWDLATSPGPSKDFEDDTTMQNDAAK